VDGVGVFPGLIQNLLVYPSSLMVTRAHLRGGRHRSSRGNPCGGSSCGRNGACPSWCPA
jgi:hypothetical protein